MTTKHAFTKPATADISAFVPGGIRLTDHCHHNTNDGTCSRCRREIDGDHVPLMLWSENGNDLWIFCKACWG